MTIRGRVVRADLGPGVFLLEAEDGRRFALMGGDAGLLRDGREVSVEGELRADAVGFGMTGDPVLEVRGYTLQGD